MSQTATPNQSPWKVWRSWWWAIRDMVAVNSHVFLCFSPDSWIPTIAQWSWCRCRLVLAAAAALSPFIPQMTGLLIPIIAKWSWRCRLVSLHPPSCVSLHDLYSGLLLAAAAALSPFTCPFMISILACSCLPLPPCLPSFVSLHDLHSGLLLAAAAALSPFICFPSWFPFWPAVGCGCRLVFLHLSPFIAFFCLSVLVPVSASSGLALHSFHSSPSLFVNAIWGLCRCNFYFF